MEGKYNVVPVN